MQPIRGLVWIPIGTAPLLLACHRQRVAVVTDCFYPAPLLPVIHFREPTTAGTITVLLLDAQSGNAITTGYIRLLDSKSITFSDSTGRATLQAVPPGRQVLETRAVGYETKQDTLTLNKQAGWSLVIQLRQVPSPFTCRNPASSPNLPS